MLLPLKRTNIWPYKEKIYLKFDIVNVTLFLYEVFL